MDSVTVLRTLSTRAVDVAFTKVSKQLDASNQNKKRKRKVWEKEDGTAEEALQTLSKARDLLNVDGQLRFYIQELEAFRTYQQACCAEDPQEPITQGTKRHKKNETERRTDSSEADAR